MEDQVKKIVIPINGQRSDERAIHIAAKIAARRPIELTLVHVVEVQQSLPLDAELPAEVEHGEAVLRSAEKFTESILAGRSESVRSELLQARSAGPAVVDEAIERHTDLIILATRLRSKHGKVGIGETARYVLTNAPCEVLLLRQPMGTALEECLLSANGASESAAKVSP